MKFMILVKAAKDSEAGRMPALVAGYTIIDVKLREEALAWTRRFPNPAVERMKDSWKKD